MNSKNLGMVIVACHQFHMGGDLPAIMEAAGDMVRLVHVADTMDHHRSHGLRYITNPPGNAPFECISISKSVTETSTGTNSSAVSVNSASTIATTP